MGRRVVGLQEEKNSVRRGNVAQDVVVEIGDPSPIRVSLGVLVHLIVSERFSTAGWGRSNFRRLFTSEVSGNRKLYVASNLAQAGVWESNAGNV